MKTRRALLFTIIVAYLLLVGCGSAGAGELAETVSPSTMTVATATSTPVLTVTPTETLLLTSTSELATTATIAPSVTPDVPLATDGPWLVFLAAVDQLGPSICGRSTPMAPGVYRDEIEELQHETRLEGRLDKLARRQQHL